MKRYLSLTLVIFLSLVAAGVHPFVPSATAQTAAFATSKTVTRTNFDNGADQAVDSRTVSVTVSDTQGLRDRQGVTVTWKGAHPTGGIITDQNSGAAAFQEYPVVLMQCRGVDDATAPAVKQVTPETCWTQTPDERFQSTSGFVYPPYRMDRYAPTVDRGFTLNQPSPLPTGCDAPSVAYWIPFDAADGKVYPGGPKGCAVVAPEAANATDSLQPANTTYGVTAGDGTGSAKFIIQTADTNASVGCSATVSCTLEIIPIMGISCDPLGTAPGGGLPAADRPDPTDTATLDVIRHGPNGDQGCENTGKFTPGQFNGGGSKPDTAVAGALWWSPSNWRNRISVPLTFGASASVCSVVSSQAQIYIYGAQAMDQAMQQWSRAFCTNSQLFGVRHVQTSEPQAKNLLALNNIEAAMQGGPPTTPFATPTVQAPAAVTGWAIAYSIDGGDGKPSSTIRLNARLLAKLLSESYFACAGGCFDFHSADAKRSGFIAMEDNPIDMSRDPEFQALNPGIPPTNYLPAAASLSVMSSDSDVMYALSSYINADPEARAWLNGDPDPWGMVVNPAYRNIQLPVVNWPLLDTHFAKFATGANQCLENNPTPWLPLVAAPVLNPATVALNMQFDIANSQTACLNNGQTNQKEGAIGREAAGGRFLVGLVSLADAERYQLNLAQLQTTATSKPGGAFSDVNRTFVGPTDVALAKAAQAMTPDDSIGSWILPYTKLQSNAGAYPGVMLMSIDVPTRGLGTADAERYARFLRFTAGTGQRPGLGNGELPPGYVPMTSGNGLGAMLAYTNAAADAIAAQKCGVVFPSGKPSTSGCPSTGGGGGGAAPGGGHTPSGTTSEPPTSTPVSSAPSGPAPSPSPTTLPPAHAAGNTLPLSTGPLGLALPVVALLACVFLSLFAWRMGVGRR